MQLDDGRTPSGSCYSKARVQSACKRASVALWRRAPLHTRPPASFAVCCLIYEHVMPEVEHHAAKWDEAGADWKKFKHAAMTSGTPPADGIAPASWAMRRHTSQTHTFFVNVPQVVYTGEQGGRPNIPPTRCARNNIDFLLLF